MKPLVAVLVVLALAGCTPTAPGATSSTPSAKPTVTATASPTPTPTPTPVKATLLGVSADGDAVTLAMSDGTSVVVDYFQPQATALASFSEAFGFAPTLVNKDGTPGTEVVASTHFDFEGFEVLGPPIDGGPGWLFRVDILVSAVRGVPITTIDGFQIGSDIAAVQSAYGAGIVANGEIFVAAPSGSYSVGLRASDDATTVTSILVPVG